MSIYIYDPLYTVSRTVAGMVLCCEKNIKFQVSTDLVYHRGSGRSDHVLQMNCQNQRAEPRKMNCIPLELIRSIHRFFVVQMYVTTRKPPPSGRPDEATIRLDSTPHSPTFPCTPHKAASGALCRGSNLDAHRTHSGTEATWQRPLVEVVASLQRASVADSGIPAHVSDYLETGCGTTTG